MISQSIPNPSVTAPLYCGRKSYTDPGQRVIDGGCKAWISLIWAWWAIFIAFGLLIVNDFVNCVGAAVPDI
ncbi:hypothetical protein GQ43DRAFT_234469 [Delitschia confertaspora ATCC 74209]|uniref:Uncharacterized protein n=1 Tax=Delitschia confertaspora ATCC 74209 TaxID=1513339 RepID=A0A9P4JFD5_9PLEO|nr:hypothetical protein GQ43DRAFT_234469 [Delitschia confertaspora ATCC 74209]